MFRDFFLGFIKVHILHHAAEEPIYGLGMIEELGRHGYEISPGRRDAGEGGCGCRCGLIRLHGPSSPSPSGGWLPVSPGA